MDFTLLLLAFFFSFISVFVASVSGDDAAHFRVCSETFDCGTKTNLSYPFWATNYRPQECGHPDFELLGCGETNQHPILITEPLQLRLLAVNQPSKTLTVALRDLWDQICPPINGTMTLNFSLLQFAPPLSDPALQNLTLFYGCSRPPPRSGAGIPLETTLPCSDPFSFYANETFLRESGLEEALEPCRGRVEFPIPADVPAGIWGSGGEKELRGVLYAGFNVSYSYGRYEALCERCEGSNRLCGTAAGTPSFMCHYRVSGKRPNVPVKVAIGVGTAVGSVVIMLILFLIYLRRRRQQQYSASTSSWLSRSILSDPSSKVELEKGTSKYFGLHVFSYAELEEATNNFDSVNELGDGGFGTVYYGKLKDGRAVAVKRLYESNCKRVEQFMNEIEILTRLRHPNLVSLYGCTSRHSRELLLVYEYISNGTVADHLHGEMAKPGALPWSTRMSIAVDTASALAYLHASEIIHRDVKTNNILLDENFVVKVADFGLSRLFPTHATHVSTAPQGTPGYVDPEYHQCYQLTSRSDVFSFGVVLVELISSMPAVDITRHRHEINLSNLAINKIQGDALHELVDHSLGFQSDASIRKMMTAVAELAFQCLQSDKDLRPSMDEVLSTLQGIQRVGDDSKKGIKVPQDVRSDDAVLLKSVVVQPLPLSPDSVTGKWLSVNTTPNTSS